MKHLMTSLALVLLALLIGCESGELGMKIKITVKPAPAADTNVAAEAQAGKLTIIVAGEPSDDSKALADTLAAAFAPLKVPEGELTFVSWSLMTPSMEYPPRASVVISTTCILKKTGKAAKCYDVSLSTFSIEIEDRAKQMDYLRNEAIKGLARELVDEF